MVRWGRAGKLAAAAALLVPTVTPEKEDDYLPCSAYEGHQVTDTTITTSRLIQQVS
ncbi:MAG: hypothetical protein R2788_12025 [Saprospiraceae bacterium]